MEYKVNPMVYTSACPIPTSIIDENLKLASASQLKTILYFFRQTTSGKTVSAEDISKAIGYEKEDCEDALIFWSERGILLKEGAEIDFSSVKPTETKNEVQEESTKQSVTESVEIPLVKPTHEQVSERLKESDEINVLFNEAQNILGKTIGFSGQSTLLMIIDNYGLPVEVLLMLIQFLKTTGKTGMSQISLLAKEWADKEILSVELAEEYISLQSKVEKIWKKFKKLSGVKNEYPTSKQKEHFEKWHNSYKMSADMIYLAYEKSIDQTGKFSMPYMEKILSNWYKAGIKTVSAVKEEEDKWTKEKEEKKTKKTSKKEENPSDTSSSYDTSQFTNFGLNLGQN